LRRTKARFVSVEMVVVMRKSDALNRGGKKRKICERAGERRADLILLDLDRSKLHVWDKHACTICNTLNTTEHRSRRRQIPFRTV
jgi:hypothetical protein